MDVTSVEPSSPLDDKFREAAQSGLLTWRFAPAEKAGQAVASETSVALQFEARDAPARGGGPGVDRGTGGEAALESARYSTRSRVALWNREMREKAKNEIASAAEALINKERRAVAADEWFEVVTDLGGQKQADAILNNAGATYAALYGLLGERIPPRPRDGRIRIYSFETNAQYQAFAAKVSPFEWSGGIYCAPGVVAFHSQHARVSFMLVAMLHETTHAFVDRHLVRAGIALPRWLDEGLAEYVANSDIKNKKLVPGGHERRKEIAMGLDGVTFWQTSSRANSEDAQRAQRQKRALSFEEIVSSGIETFYGKDRDLYYAQGWLAVHFLRHGRPEWSAGAFPEFLLYAAEGYAATDALRAAYGVEPAALEAAYQKYVKTF